MAAIDAVLPCLNEAAGLAWLLERLPPWAYPLVVDNGSTDGTAEVAPAAGCRLVTAAQRGYGAVLASYLPHLLVTGWLVLGYLPGYLGEEGFDRGHDRYAVLALLLPPPARAPVALRS